ncbi:MAG: hypothetical protein IJC73_04635 [Lentisphaeria bacterium]|nr:hypothetical protein [Lentisphaeria bacterium]
MNRFPSSFTALFFVAPACFFLSGKPGIDFVVSCITLKKRTELPSGFTTQFREENGTDSD